MKYERLTIRETFGMPFCAHQVDNDCLRLNCNGCPAIINRLAELEDKIENGTLVELPCKMGDKVYVIYNNWETDELDIRITDVIGYEIMRDELWVKTSIPYRKNYIEINRVFLTKDEAEKRLEELRGER